MRCRDKRYVYYCCIISLSGLFSGKDVLPHVNVTSAFDLSKEESSEDNLTLFSIGFVKWLSTLILNFKTTGVPFGRNRIVQRF